MKKTQKYYCWLILLIIALLMFSMNLLQYQLAPFADSIKAGMGFSDAEYSRIFTAPMFPAVFVSLVFGIVIDKFGIRVPISIGISVAALGAIMMNFAHSFFFMFACFFLIGIGLTMINANIMKIMDRWFFPAQIALCMGLFTASSKLAQVVGALASQLYRDYETALIFSAIFVAIPVILWLIFGREYSKFKGPPAEVKSTVPVLTALKRILKSKNVWIIALGLMLVNGTNIATASVLYSAVFSRTHSDSIASAVNFAFAMGGTLGALFGPMVLRRFQNKKIPFIVCGLVTAVVLSFAWRLPLIPAIILAFTGGTMITSALPVLMSMPVQLPEIASEIAGTCGGLCATFQLFGAVVVPSYIIAPIAGSNYTLFFIMIGGCGLLFAILSLFMPVIRSTKPAPAAAAAAVSDSAEG